MLHDKEPTLRSFFRGKPLRRTSPLLSTYIPVPFSFPMTPWPPSLVPTWKTTAWTGMCFSHTKKGVCDFVQGCEAGQENALIFPWVDCRGTSLIAANARAPPSEPQEVTKRTVRSMV